MRILKNTIFLFFRSIIILLIGLYASRVLLEKLGIEDYGIYSIVAGVVLLFGSLRTMFTNAIQRFLNYGRGLGDAGRVNRVFITGIQVQLILAGVLLVLAETVGLIAFLHLNIPAAKVPAAAAVYQLTIVSTLLSMVTLPYDALIISNERLDVYAWLSMLEHALKLGIIFLIGRGPFSLLVNYAVLLLVVTCLMRILAILFCKRHFPEAKLRRVYDKPLMREMRSFAGWNFLGNTGLQITHEGVNYILNQFGGVVVNAARSLSYSVMGGIKSLVADVNVAFKPQTNASAAQEDKERFHQLLAYNAKTAFLCYLFLAVPVLIFARQILRIWLGQVPGHVVVFLYALSGYHLLRSLHELVNQFFVSIGQMRDYQLIEICTMVLIIPLSVFMLREGLPFWTVFIAMTFLEALNHSLTVWLATKRFSFPLRRFAREVYLPFFGMTLLSSGLVVGALLLNINATDSWPRIILYCVTLEAILLAAAYAMVLNRSDRQRLRIIVFRTTK